jgi:hypothetical protein
MPLNEEWLSRTFRIRQTLDHADATLSRVRMAIGVARVLAADEEGDGELQGLALDVARLADQIEAAVMRVVEENPSARLAFDQRDYVVDDSWIDALGEDTVLELVCPKPASHALLRAGGWLGNDRSLAWQRDRDRALRTVARRTDAEAGLV